MLQLRLLRTPEINIAGQPPAGALSNKAQAILYYLAVIGRPQTRSVLATLLWGDMPEATARTNLRKALAVRLAGVKSHFGDHAAAIPLAKEGLPLAANSVVRI